MTNEVIANVRVQITSEGFLKLDQGAKKVKAIVPIVDVKNRKITVVPPAGLLDE